MHVNTLIVTTRAVYDATSLAGIPPPPCVHDAGVVAEGLGAINSPMSRLLLKAIVELNCSHHTIRDNFLASRLISLS